MHLCSSPIIVFLLVTAKNARDLSIGETGFIFPIVVNPGPDKASHLLFLHCVSHCEYRVSDSVNVMQAQVFDESGKLRSLSVHQGGFEGSHRQGPGTRIWKRPQDIVVRRQAPFVLAWHSRTFDMNQWSSFI